MMKERCRSHIELLKSDNVIITVENVRARATMTSLTHTHTKEEGLTCGFT